MKGALFQPRLETPQLLFFYRSVREMSEYLG